VNLSSISVRHAVPGNALYGAAKTAVEQVTRVFAKEVIAFGITANVLSLPLVERVGMGVALPDVAVADALQHTALGRAVTPQEVAHAVDCFLTPQSGIIAGQILYLGGP
jgi:3-oxoacyl-[acyl-carrier protein] reductase